MITYYVSIIYLCIILFNTFFIYKLFKRDAKEFGTTTWFEIKRMFNKSPLSMVAIMIAFALVPFGSLLIYNQEEP